MSHIIFMRGIETRLELVEGFEESQRLTEELAERVGVECIVGETNIRTTCRLHWEHRYVGCGLAATALSLAGGLDLVCVPSSSSYRDLAARGSSPLIEERLSSESLRILFDGGEASRAEKTGCIVDWEKDLVMRYLRVCTRNRGGDFNCGECYKCVRTAIALAAVGVWGDARLFRNTSTDHWERSAREDKPHLVAENQAFARKVGADASLVAMLDRLMHSHKRATALKALMEGTRLERLVHHIGRARKLGSSISRGVHWRPFL